jgi:hypothetical protein
MVLEGAFALSQIFSLIFSGIVPDFFREFIDYRPPFEAVPTSRHQPRPFRPSAGAYYLGKRELIFPS